MVSPPQNSAPSDDFTRMPMFQITTAFAERFQGCRNVYIENICDPVSKHEFGHCSRGDSAHQNRVRASIKDNIVMCIVLVAACVVIVVSSHHLLDSLTSHRTEAWQRCGILLAALAIGLTDCIAIGVSQWGSGYYGLAEGAVSAALGSSARLLSALLSVSTLLDWSMGAAASALSLNVSHWVLLVVAICVQIGGKGW
jgi:hypothetical protein